MFNKKIISILTIAIIIIIFIFLLLYVKNKKDYFEKTETIDLPTQSQNKSFSKPQNLQTNPSRSDSVGLSSQQNNEALIVLKIEESIKSKNIDQIKNSILLVDQNTDNESFFEVWREYLLTNSDTLLKIAKEGDSKLTKGVYFIFEWFIYLSGDFEDLTNSKREELSNQFLEIKTLIK